MAEVGRGGRRLLTEDLWLTSASPNTLLHYLRPWTRHRRKLQLYVCGWYRHCWPLLNEPCRQLVEVCERANSGFASQAQVTAAKRAVKVRAQKEWAESGPNGLAEVGPGLLRQLRLEHLPGLERMPPVITYFDGTDEQRRRNEEEHAALTKVQLALLREVLGNPFRRSAFENTWRTSKIVALSQWIYANFAFDCLSVLADVLEDAGCVDKQLLDHCRGPGLHVRGCWALDFALGCR